MLFSSFFIITVTLVSLPDYSSSCSENEIESECVNPCNTCEQRGRCEPPPDCQQGCDCKYGFFRDENGYCVPEQQCRGKTENRRCPKNALYVPCCPLVLPSCENPEPEPNSDDECVPGCACKPGFLKRNDQCVTPDQCYSREDHGKENPDRKCPKNAIFIECGSPCPPTCDDMQPKPCEEKCIRACYCKPGYLVRKDGVCVRPIYCHPRKKQERSQPECPENAIFIECGSPCPPTCANRLPGPCEENCTKACYCKPGYLLKTPEGKCVKPEQCNTRRIPVHPQPKCAADEQFYECTPSCKNTCENIYNPEVKCQCGPPGCFCKEGLVKRDDGKCVPPDQCQVTPQPECKADEQFYECTPSCRNNCENFRNRAARCYCGPPGCFCKEGLNKRADGKCVPPNQCRVLPQRECGVDQKFYNCTPSCKNTCKNFFNPGIRCGCGPPGCFCKDGLVKRADGKCIPPNQCLARKPDVCPENAEFSDCGPPCRPTCSDPYPAPCAGACVKGCFCKSGFVQDTDGKCVRLQNCKRSCLRPGEEFQACGSTCPDTCENRGRPPPASCPYRCVRGCFCKQGLYRTQSGRCVPLKDCDDERYFATTSKPMRKREETGSFPTTVPVDCHGCPRRAECEAYCKSLGDFIGLCTGEGRLHCRCA